VKGQKSIKLYLKLGGLARKESQKVLTIVGFEQLFPQETSTQAYNLLLHHLAFVNVQP
jgi:hypothetical protein